MKKTYRSIAMSCVLAAFTFSVAAQEEVEMVTEKQKKGMEMVGVLLEGTGAGGLPLPERFSRYTIEHLFGDVWQGDDLSLQDRSFVTCIALIALNLEQEQKLHFVGARNVGVPREKLEAAITQIAHYAGWPVALTAFKTLDEVWPAESEAEEQ